MIRRREFITLLGGAVVAWPLGAHVQIAPFMRRIGVLTALAGLREKVGSRGGISVSNFVMSPAVTWTIFEWRQESLYHSHQT
jgi:hypothetical protein